MGSGTTSIFKCYPRTYPAKKVTHTYMYTHTRNTLPLFPPLCSLDGEVDHCVQLVSPAAVVGEALQVHHQDAGQRPQVKLLSGLLVLLTGRTVPSTHTHTHNEYTNIITRIV